MKKGVVSLLFCLLAGNIFGQMIPPNYKDLKLFFRTQLMVVLDDNYPGYNTSIKKAMDYWSITKYGVDYITKSELPQHLVNPRESFLVIKDTTIVENTTSSTYVVLQLILGNRSKRVKTHAVMTTFPICYKGKEEMNYYRLPTFIQFIQSHLIFLEKYETIPPKEIFNYYNSRSYEIKSRELWLIKEEVDPTVDELGEIKAMYPYDVVFVTQEQLQKAIEKQYLDIVYMHKVGLGANKKGDYVVKFIFTADGELYYYDQYFVEPVKSPEGFSEKDIRRIDR